MYHYSGLVTCLAIAFYFFTTTRVSAARAKFSMVPATSGHPDFERVFRVPQMNTLEWMPIFLPSLWLFAIYISDPVAGALGIVWIAGRSCTGTAIRRPPQNAAWALRSSSWRVRFWAGALGMALWRLLHG